MFAGPAPYEKNVAPAPLAPCDWSGFYVGLNFGVGEYEVNVTDNEYYEGFDTLHATDINVLGGGQVGFNWQKGAAVFGLEADGAWANFSAHNTVSNDGALGDYFRRGGEIDFFGTVRGRLGLAYENVLAYVTAGVAFAEGDRSAHYNEENPPARNEFADWNADDWRVGVVGGVGVEYMVNCHWTVKAETLFAAFAPDNRVGVSDQIDAGAEGYTWSFDDKVMIVRLGVNYKFGGGH